MTSAIRESIQSCLMRMLLVLLSLGIYKGFGSPVSGMQSKAKHENKRSSYLSGNHECFSSSVPAPEGQRHISVFLSPPHSSPQISIFKNSSNTIFLCLKFCTMGVYMREKVKMVKQEKEDVVSYHLLCFFY